MHKLPMQTGSHAFDLPACAITAAGEDIAPSGAGTLDVTRDMMFGFEILQFAEQAVVVGIRNRRIVELVVAPVVLLDLQAQFGDTGRGFAHGQTAPSAGCFAMRQFHA